MRALQTLSSKCLFSNGFAINHATPLKGLHCLTKVVARLTINSGTTLMTSHTTEGTALSDKGGVFGLPFVEKTEEALPGPGTYKLAMTLDKRGGYIGGLSKVDEIPEGTVLWAWLGRRLCSMSGVLEAMRGVGA
jgi:hypothetical protein